MRLKSLTALLTFLSSFAFSFAVDEDRYLCLSCAGGFIKNINSEIVTALGTLFLAVSVVGFFLGVVRFIWAQQTGEEKGIKAGKETLKWGLIALFCAFSVYGIIRFGQNVLFTNADDVTNIKLPKFILDTNTTGDGRVPTGNVGQPRAVPTGTSPSEVPMGSTPSNGPSAGRGIVPNCGAYATWSNGACVPNSSGSGGQTKQQIAQAAFDGCRANNVSLAVCQTAYTQAGGQGNALQALADQTYQNCIDGGGLETDCGNAYTAVLTAGYENSVENPTVEPTQP